MVGPLDVDSSVRIRSQVDCIMVPKRFRNGILSARAYPEADCNSDYNPVVIKFRIWSKKLEKAKRVVCMNVQQMKANPEKRNEFSAKIPKKLNDMKMQNNIESGPEQIDQLLRRH